VVVTVLAILLSVLGSVARAQTGMCAGGATCDVSAQSCLCCRDAETVDLCAAAPDLINGRNACLATVTDTFNTCTNRCNPADSVQGRCAWIRNCLDQCRATQTRQMGGCWTRYRNQLRSNGCPGSFVAGKKARRRCQHAKCNPCCCPTLPTTTTSTTSTTTTVTSPSTTTSTTTTTTLAGAATTGSKLVTSSRMPLDVGVPAQADCQSTCITQIVSACYRNCASNCGVDFQARGICNQFCRNANCRFLTLKCTDNGQPDSGEYRACCSQAGTCTTDINCAVTTTTTSTTSTTSTSSTTSSTSIFATTTFTTTTAIGATTSTTNPFAM
jgi:hypothetical protein